MHLKQPKWLRGGRRDAILDVAREVFSEEGYAAASMSHIAARLGGSKGTLYNYFKSKEELFAAYVQERCACNAQEIFGEPGAGENIAEALTTIGENMLSFFLANESMAFYCLVIAEAQRNPAVGRAFYDSGPATAIRGLAAFLERAQGEGQIVAENFAEAAEAFIALLRGGLLWRRMMRVVASPSQAEIHAEAVRVTELFMLAYGPRARSPAVGNTVQ